MRRAMLIVATACGRIEFEPVSESRRDAMVVAPPDTSGPDASVCAGYTPVPALGSSYLAIAMTRQWIDAETSCELDGAHQAVIDSSVERDYLAQLASSFVPTQAWIGLTDHVAEGSFRWITGQPLAMPSWANSEPNNAMNNEDCVHIAANRTDNDNDCTIFFASICECDSAVLPVPATWCDTTQPASCGTCGNACVGTQTCNNQVCI